MDKNEVVKGVRASSVVKIKTPNVPLISFNCSMANLIRFLV